MMTTISTTIQRIVMERQQDNDNLFITQHDKFPPTVSSWKEAIVRGGDPRLANLPFMGSSIPITIVLISYVLFVKLIGPYVMKHRQPFELRFVILCYNFFMIVVSTSQFVRGGIYGWFGSYSYTCQPIDYSYSRDGYGMALTAYIYFLSKIVELADTVFFVLRKKFSHISTLHVTHHALVAYLMYWGVKYFPGGHGSFQGFANSFVHMVMYTYYFVSALGPQFHRLLWWKRYLTQIQMIQFVLIFLHGTQILFYRSCDYPRLIAYPYLAVVVYLMIMFVNFYRKAYLIRSERKRRRKLEQEQELEKAKQSSPSSPTPQCLLISVHENMTSDESKTIEVTKFDDNNNIAGEPSFIRQRIRRQEVEEDEETKASSKKVM